MSFKLVQDAVNPLYYRYGPATIKMALKKEYGGAGAITHRSLAMVKLRSKDEVFEGGAADVALARAMSWVDETTERGKRKHGWTDWKFDSDRDAHAFAAQIRSDGKYTADRPGMQSEWVATNAPDAVALNVGEDRLGLIMQRRDRYVG